LELSRVADREILVISLSHFFYKIGKIDINLTQGRFVNSHEDQLS